MKKTMRDSVGDFMAGKGFYIVLLLCVAALGVSGYYLFSGFTDPPAKTVSAPVSVVVTPKPAAQPTPPVNAAPTTVPVPPSTAAPRPTPAATAAPAPAVTAAPAATPAPTPATATASVFTWPVKGEVLRGHDTETLYYDETMADWRTHEGVDIAALAGTEVMAPAGGSVENIEVDDMMGTTVVIRHANDVVSTCANLASEPTVEIGDTVRTGDVIGSVGTGAIAESLLPSHLHLSMTKDNVEVDPLEYLPEK